MALEVPAGLVSPPGPRCHLLWGCCHPPGLVSPLLVCIVTCRGAGVIFWGWCHPLFLHVTLLVPSVTRHRASITLVSPPRPCCHLLQGGWRHPLIPVITLLWGWCHPLWLVPPPCPQCHSLVPSLTRRGTGVTPHPSCHLLIPSITACPRHHLMSPASPPCPRHCHHTPPSDMLMVGGGEPGTPRHGGDTSPAVPRAR